MSVETNYPRPFGIHQIITLGSDFNGAVPGTVATFANDVLSYPTAIVGGKFDPHSDVEYKDRGGAPLKVLEFWLLMDGGQATWSIKKVTAAGKKITILDETSQAAATDVLISESDGIRLLPGEWLEVLTGGCAAEVNAGGMFAPVEG
jgi:hypothetical protein